MPRKLRVLLAGPLPPPYSGQEMVNYWLLRSDLAKCHDFIHLDISNRRSNRFRGRFDLGNVYATLRPLPEYLKLLLFCRPEILHVQLARNRLGFLKSSIYILIAALFKVKVVARLGGDHFDVFWRRASRSYRLYITTVLRRIDKLIVEGEGLKRQFLNLRFPDEKLEVVHSAVDASAFGTAKEQTNGKLRVLYLGHISKAKGALDLLHSIPDVVKEIQNISFLFAGEVLKREYNLTHFDNSPDLEAEIQDTIRNHRLQDHVQFLGEIKGTEKINTLSNSDIFVLPSYSEGFPFAALEAAASGLPLIATRVGALPEVFKEGENALFVTPGDVASLANEIVKLAGDSKLRRRMGRLNRALISKRFNLQKLTKQMDLIFRAVASESQDKC